MFWLMRHTRVHYLVFRLENSCNSLLDESSWTANTIKSSTGENPRHPDENGIRPTRFRKVIKALNYSARPRLYITALGLYKVYLNEHRVGDECLAADRLARLVRHGSVPSIQGICRYARYPRCLVAGRKSTNCLPNASGRGMSRLALPSQQRGNDDMETMG